MKMGVDIETYSSVDLQKAGVRPYTEAPDFTILLIGYRVDDQPTRIIDLADSEDADLTLLPPVLSDLPAGDLDEFLCLLTSPEVVKTAYNASFERTCLARYFARPMLPEQWRCTMVQAATLGLPGTLAQVGAALGLEKQKLTEGAELIRYFCKPAKDGTRHYPKDAPDKWERFRKYNVRDVDVETDIRDRLARWPRPPAELAAWELDQRINDRGVRLDAGLLDKALELDGQYSARLMAEARQLTALGNPNSDIPDIDRIAEIAHAHGLPLVIDNTFGTPYLIRPIEHGADIVVHSATKFIGGHGTTLGGIIVDSGKFDWAASGKFPELTTPDKSYHGLIFTEHFGSAAFAAKMRVSAMRDIGGTISPFNSFLIQQGIGTLHLRMERHVENAKKLAKFLQNHKNVAWVDYNGLKDNKNHKNADKFLTLGGGSLLTFGVKGGFEKSKQFIEKVSLALHVSNLGDIKTIVTHPASTTHRQLSEQELASSGVTADLIRVSVGIENIDDITADFDKALGN